MMRNFESLEERNEDDVKYRRGLDYSDLSLFIKLKTEEISKHRSLMFENKGKSWF